MTLSAPTLPDAAGSATRPSAGVGAAHALALRGCLYLLLLLGLMWGVLQLAQMGDGHDYGPFRESSLVESGQLVLTLGSAAVLFAAGRRAGQTGRVMRVLALGAVLISVRELDGYFDDLLPVGGWQLPAGLCVAGIVWIIARDAAGFWRELTPWVTTHAFGIFWCAAATSLIFAQLIGQADLWKSVMGDSYERAFKRVLEESTELFGYALLLIGALEMFFLVPRRTADAR